MPPEQIDRAVGALLALALDLAVADQAIEPRASEYQERGSAARPQCRIAARMSAREYAPAAGECGACRLRNRIMPKTTRIAMTARSPESLRIRGLVLR
jgi:hypothetical protein